MTELPRVKIIGLTGMSGAGKSTVSRTFAENGYYVIDCDSVARETAGAGSPFLRELAGRFDGFVRADGTLDRAAVAGAIFADGVKRALYNKIIYPYITYNVIARIKRAAQDGEQYVLLDAPTLFEARLDGICADIVSVIAPAQTCAERIMRRDGLSAQGAQARLSAQHGAQFYASRSRCVIENSGTGHELCEKARAVAESLKR